MVDWRGSSLQIVVALIGSSLIVTALTSVSSYFSKPSLEIYVEVGDRSFLDTIYRIYLVNSGYSTAKDVRLTVTFPNVTVVNSTMIYQNENFSLTQTPNSVVAFSPRLSTDVKIGIESNITGVPRFKSLPPVLIKSFNVLQDFDTDYHNDYYYHRFPFSITVTHDEGGNTYRPPLTFGDFAGITKMYFDPDALKFFIPITTGILLIGIAHRHRKKSLSKFASDVLEDIETAEKRLIEPDSKVIIDFKNYDFKVENELESFDNYEYYKLIDEFYTGLRERESRILNPNLRNLDDVLKEENRKCYNLAVSAHTNIDWKKFHKLDLILLIPSVFLGSYFITLICEGVPNFLYSLYWFTQTQFIQTHLILVTLISLFATIILFFIRTIGTFFIMRLIFHRVQGHYISAYLFPKLYRKRKLFILSAAIMGFPTQFIVLVILGLMAFSVNISNPETIAQYQLQTQILLNYSATIIIVFDIIRMLLLTWQVSKDPRKEKKKKTN